MKVIASGLVMIAFLSVSQLQVIPGRYTWHDNFEPVSVNGSSATAICSNVAVSGSTRACNDPTSSVLFDGHIPTLTGLDGDTWASQLLTIDVTYSEVRILFDFTDTPNYAGVEVVEVVAFTCPEWEIAAQELSFEEYTTWPYYSGIGSNTLHTCSCEHLVRYCLHGRTTHTLLGLRFQDFCFFRNDNFRWLHLAEVTFHTDSSACPHNTIITPPPPTVTCTPATTSPPSLATTNTSPPPPASQDSTSTSSTATECEVCLTSDMVSEVCPPCSTPENAVCPPCPTSVDMVSEMCPFSSTSVVLASVITAITTALLATVIFVLVLIAVCKCHPKFTPGGAETGTSAGDREGQELNEQIDTGDVAVSDPTYMEVGPAKGKTFELKENEAYGTCL